MLGAVVAVGTLAGVSSIVAAAQASPATSADASAAAVTTTGAPSGTALPRFTTSTRTRLHWERVARVKVHATPPLPSPAATTPAASATPDPSATSDDSAEAVEAAVTATPSATATPSSTPSASDSPSATPSSAQSASSAPSSSASTSAAPSRSSSDSAAASGTTERLFAAESPWNTPIPAGAAVDEDSAGVVSSVLNNRSLVVNLNMYAFGIPFYTATASTPRVTLNGAKELGPVPLDPSWRPNEGADHKMNVIDPTTHTVFELQGFDAGARSVYWAVKKDYRTSLADGYPADGRAGPTGSGLTQAGGVVRLSEMASGKIDHALSFITSRPVNRFRYPASHSDGNIGGIGLEEGMRVQLDPSVDVDRIPGITPGEKAVAKALQRYGAYCTDTGGGNNQAMGIYVEKPKAGDKDPYPAAGFPQDWAQLPHIPRDKLRVLAADVTPRPN